eukprot:scaffold1466_cov385-Prasinococcus_capsulatus_cf.AAC.18
MAHHVLQPPTVAAVVHSRARAGARVTRPEAPRPYVTACLRSRGEASASVARVGVGQALLVRDVAAPVPHDQHRRAARASGAAGGSHEDTPPWSGGRGRGGVPTRLLPVGRREQHSLPALAGQPGYCSA